MYNTSTPEKPILIDHTIDNVAQMYCHNGYLYAKKLEYLYNDYRYTNTLLVFSIEENKLTLVDTVYNTFISEFTEMFVEATRDVLITSGREITLWDITNPAHPEFLSRFDYRLISPEDRTFRSDGIALHPTEAILLVSINTYKFILLDYTNTSELQRIYMDHDTD